jgi:hypothetical protein
MAAKPHFPALASQIAAILRVSRSLGQFQKADFPGGTSAHSPLRRHDVVISLSDICRMRQNYSPVGFAPPEKPRTSRSSRRPKRRD